MTDRSWQRNRLAVRTFGKLARFAGWLQGLPARMVPPPFRLVQMGAAFWQSCALAVAARLDLAGALGEETLPVEEAARRVDADPETTFRLLRLLAAGGIFEEVAPRRFRNNRLSAHLRADHPHSVRPMILMHNAPHMTRPWYEALEAGVRTGTVPFARVHGAELFDYLEEHPELDAQFAAAMKSIDALTGEAFATDFDWGRCERIIDVGGAQGAKALTILKHHSRLRAVVVDRPQVIAGARTCWQGKLPEALLTRIEFTPGDLFGPLPHARGAGDIYLLSALLHGFSDEACARALANLRSCIGESGARVAVMELVLPERGADYAGASFDMQMFMATRGRERTLNEWRTLAAGAGYLLEEVVGVRPMVSILVLRPG